MRRTRKKYISRKRRSTRKYKQRGGTQDVPKIAWAYWDSETPPKSIQDIMNSRADKIPGWESKYLSEKTIGEYIDKNTYPAGFEKLIAPHKADWIRLALLEKYGGVWLDAGIIINDVSEMNKIYDILTKEAAEAGVFYLNHHGYKDNIPTYIDNWFIMAPKQSPIIIKWKQEFERAITMGLQEYKQSILKPHMIYPMFDPNNVEDVYLMPQAALQNILQNSPNKPKLLLLCPGENMFKIHSMCSDKNGDENNEKRCIQHMLLNDPMAKKLPHIKLRSANRDNLNLGTYFQ